MRETRSPAPDITHNPWPDLSEEAPDVLAQPSQPHPARNHFVFRTAFTMPLGLPSISIPPLRKMRMGKQPDESRQSPISQLPQGRQVTGEKKKEREEVGEYGPRWEGLGSSSSRVETRAWSDDDGDIINERGQQHEAQRREPNQVKVETRISNSMESFRGDP
jgi:hypothetical protein